MNKKTRKIKGGRTTLENIIGLSDEGPLITENLYQRVKKHKGTDLKDEYKMRKEIKDAEYKIAHDEFKDEEERNFVLADKQFKYNKLHKDDFMNKMKLIVYSIGGIFKFFGELIPKLINTAKDIGLKIGSMVGNGAFNTYKGALGIFDIGRGAVVKFLLLLLFIALIIGAAFGFSGNRGGGNMSGARNNNNFKLLVSQKDNSIFGQLTSSLDSMIPDAYKIQFTGFRNSFNKMVGNDTVANLIDNQPRETINTGRYNGITNVKKNNDNERIYNIFRPSNKTLTIDLDSYKETDIDFYKLPKGVQDDILNIENGIKLNKIGDNNKYEFNFIVKTAKTTDGREKYKYEMNSNATIPIETDRTLQNYFNIISKPINPISITQKDYEKNRNNLMFNFVDNKFEYPKDDFYKYKK